MRYGRYGIILHSTTQMINYFIKYTFSTVGNKWSKIEFSMFVQKYYYTHYGASSEQCRCRTTANNDYDYLKWWRHAMACYWYLMLLDEYYVKTILCEWINTLLIDDTYDVKFYKRLTWRHNNIFGFFFFFRPVYEV